MKRATRASILVLSLFLILATACSTSEQTTQDENTDDASHSGESMAGMDHTHLEAPEEFAVLANPFAGDEEAIRAGETIFQTNCARCHGPEGKGDGPEAEGLDPKPASLADSTMMNALSDGYLFWRVSKGGQMAPFNSAMPAWETALTEDERWQVIGFLRTLAEESDEHMDDHEHTDDGEHTDDHDHSD